MMFSIYPPATGGFTPTSSSVQSPQFALSPDGRRVVFVAALEREPSQLWIRELGALNPQPIAGTQGAEYPFWSPDSASVAFFAGGSLKRIDLAGGPPRVLAPAMHGRGGAWNSQGLILYAPTTQDGSVRGGCHGRRATASHAASGRHSEKPRIAGRSSCPTTVTSSTSFRTPRRKDTASIWVIWTSRPRAGVRAAPASAVFAASGHLLFVAGRCADGGIVRLESRTTGWGADADRLAGGDVEQLLWRVLRVADRTGGVCEWGSAPLKWSGWRGTDSARPRRCRRDSTRTSGCRPTTSSWRSRKSIPQTHRPDIRVLDLTRGSKLRITADAATDASPIWSPDGQRVVFRSNRGGVHDLFVRASNGTSESAPLFRSGNAKYPTDWTPDGGSIVYHTYESATGADIWMMKADGSQASPLLNGPFDEMQGQVAPGGAWIAYTSTETGHAGGLRAQSRRPDAAMAGVGRWRPRSALARRCRGAVLHLRRFSGECRGVQRRPADARQSGCSPCSVAPPGLPYLSNYDVTRDGQRFLIRVPVHDLSSAPIHVMTDWRALAPR